MQSHNYVREFTVGEPDTVLGPSHELLVLSSDLRPNNPLALQNLHQSGREFARQLIDVCDYRFLNGLVEELVALR